MKTHKIKELTEKPRVSFLEFFKKQSCTTNKSIGQFRFQKDIIKDLDNKNIKKLIMRTRGGM